MRLKRKAVIDIGTNSVKLLVAEVRGVDVRPLLENSWQTRLGRGLYATRRLHAEAIAQTANAVREFAEMAVHLGAKSIHVIATSAAREADNPEDLAAAVRAASGLELEIISGQQEADWVYAGVTTDTQLADEPLLILDVGGGSSEFILGARGHCEYRQSFDVGSVRLMEMLRPEDPPGLHDLAQCRNWLTDFCQQQIAPELGVRLGEAGRRQSRLVGTGGTTTILARMIHRAETYDRRRLDGTRLSQSQVLQFMVDLWSLSLAERQQIAGLPPNRADIILMGVGIYEAVMQHFAFAELFVSTRGLRFGALLDPA